MKSMFFALVTFLLALNLCAGNLNWPEKDSVKGNVELTIHSSPIQTIFLVLNFYRKGISPNDFTACPFIPSCSRFMEESIESFGWVGLLMGFDRLMRDNPWVSEGYYYYRRGHYLDPPSWHYLPYYWRLNVETLDILLNADR